MCPSAQLIRPYVGASRGSEPIQSESMQGLDQIDEELLRHLVDDGRMSNAELGRRVGLSPNAAGARVARLLDRGVIAGIHARVDHGALGRGIEAIVHSSLTDPGDSVALEAFLAEDDRIIEALFVTGTVDYRLRVVVASTDDLRDLLVQLSEKGGVRDSDTRLILHRFPVAGLPGNAKAKAPTNQ